ncbi:hypothetical protein Micbo1qcDRAFT_162960 [Microdochium bolleyi]|uniref:PPP4R2-domain-containing protein n=1 Tax=Microdochium bolleyi TaxID=196109 RepID=A0A136J2B5_9PEZI|nr:hypothetical protein Micbo1qcDRAFT_162960 [Microdochium bolleyi]
MMETDDNDVLTAVAASGTMDYSLWPALMPRIVSRIEQIARNEFPMPQVTAPLPYPPEPWTFPEDTIPPMPPTPPRPTTPHSGREANKENSPERPSRGDYCLEHPPGPAVDPVHGELMSTRYADWPQALAIKIAYITHTLETYFTTYPPHTIQRLAELLLEPKRHYKSLPAFLHAIDRVVHVTSGLNVYPLPPAVQENFSGTLLSNGVSTEAAPAAAFSAAPSPFATPGSDEALGGALLTPIPWLTQPTAASPPAGASATATPDAVGEQQSAASSSTSPTDLEGQVRTESTETIEGPNGMGSVETVSVSVNGVPSMGARGVGVTQGELLRQEQKAGVVPVSQLVPGHHARHQGAMLMQQRLSASAGAGMPGSSASSDTLEGADGQQRDTAADDEMADESDKTSSGAMASVSALDDEKPHARGPEEIGLEDTGLQHDTSGGAGSGHLTAITTSGATGSSLNMHGIDIEAAVGRRAAGPASSTNDGDGDHDMDKATIGKGPEGSDNDEDVAAAGGTAGDTSEGGDQMEVDNEDGRAHTPAASSTGTLGRSREGTPSKREADSSGEAVGDDDVASKKPKTDLVTSETEQAGVADDAKTATAKTTASPDSTAEKQDEGEAAALGSTASRTDDD